MECNVCDSMWPYDWDIVLNIVFRSKVKACHIMSTIMSILVLYQQKNCPQFGHIMNNLTEKKKMMEVLEMTERCHDYSCGSHVANIWQHVLAPGPIMVEVSANTSRDSNMASLIGLSSYITKY
ncbi:hypothetical protein O6H91_21G005300 [Diphasiastrum complanatum]|uniref:Uncharacterized protein n=1 Tax=Diphasiastrum complanatum TaxID=34168 RepID=A0ACC2AHG2_DIPCM|nr:hypothetical protein O6H91_21G005300 [Diphasiastrum complanatum]